MADEIIRELWRVKDKIAQEHNYDLDALVAHLRSVNRSSGRTVVDLGAAWRGFRVCEEPSSYDPKSHTEPDDKQEKGN